MSATITPAHSNPSSRASSPAPVLFERLASARMQCLAFFIVMMAVALGGWIRPPLSSDIRAWHLPLFQTVSTEAAANAIVYGPRKVYPLGIATVVVTALGIGLVLTLRRPRRFGIACAGVLAVTVLVLGVLIFKHPLLYAALIDQSDQYSRMAGFLSDIEQDAVTDVSDARVAPSSVASSGDGAGLGHGAPFLWQGKWLAVLAGIGALFGLRGTVGRRLVVTGGALVIGAVGAILICHGPLRSEFHFRRAWQQEQLGLTSKARESLDRAIAACKPIESLERVWLLKGRLDERENVDSPERAYFAALRLERDGQSQAAVDRLRAALTGRFPDAEATLQCKLSRLLTKVGLAEFEADRLAPAVDHFASAKSLSPTAIDAAMFVGLVQSKLDPQHPERAESLLAPVLGATADRLIRADILATLGDTYFEAGRMVEARDRYRASIRAFNLPKQINYRAQRGLVGM